jgi:branched-chain amino acid aminotransferase
MSVVVNVNGRLYGEHDAVVSVFDHGFLYGDGVYEVLRTYHRRPFLFGAHQRRLRESAARIALDVPWSDDEMLGRVQATIDTLPAAGEAYVRMVLTRGVGELSYDPSACPVPTLVVIARPHVPPPAAIYDEGVKISIVDVVRNHPGTVSPRIKSNNLLNNILAMQQALKRGGFEALMRNYRGEIVEGSQSNFFLVRRGEIVTPPLEAGLLAGITRAFVFDLGKECGIAVREAHVFEDDLPQAAEAFLSSTTKEIVPVVRVDDYLIGSGTPGPIVGALSDAFRRHAAALERPPMGRPVHS